MNTNKGIFHVVTTTYFSRKNLECFKKCFRLILLLYLLCMYIIHVFVCMYVLQYFPNFVFSFLFINSAGTIHLLKSTLSPQRGRKLFLSV